MIETRYGSQFRSLEINGAVSHVISASAENRLRVSSQPKHLPGDKLSDDRAESVRALARRLIQESGPRMLYHIRDAAVEAGIYTSARQHVAVLQALRKSESFRFNTRNQLWSLVD